jgi:hypothetical protein
VQHSQLHSPTSASVKERKNNVKGKSGGQLTHSIVQRHRGYIIVVINQINQSLGNFLCATQLELVVEMMHHADHASA